MKKLWIVTGIIVIVGLVAGGTLFFSQKKSQTSTSHVTEATSPTPVPFMLTTWTDAAGFSFQYPKDLTVNNHEDDNVNYAHVELTSATHPGSIIVWASDLPTGVTDVASWVKKDASLSAGMVIDTTLGGEPAKKIIISSPTKTLTVGTVSEGLLFSVVGTLTDNEYWSRVHDTITGSFAFTPDTGSSAPASGSNAASGDQGVDEEEVVQ